MITFENFVPYGKQIDFLRSPTRYKLFGGGMGGGKTYVISAHIIKCSLKWPQSAWVLSRYRGRDLRRTTLPVFLEMLPQKLIQSYNKTEGHIKLKNQSDIYCMDLEDPNKIKSMNLSGFAIDEATDVPTIDAFNMLTTRLRKNIPNVKYFGLLASNPEPGWVKDLFITSPNASFAYFQSLPKDNPYLDPNYLKELYKTLPPALIARYLEASWDDFADQIINPAWILSPIPDFIPTYKITFVDPAVSEKTNADETAIVTLGIDDQNRIQDVEVVKGRFSFSDIKTLAKTVFDRQKPNMFYVENVQAQDWLVQELNNKGVPVIGYKPDTDKIRKFISVTDLFQIGQIHIQNRDLLRQLHEFPNGTHDDVADAFVSALIHLKKLGRHNQKPIIEVKTIFDAPRYKENVGADVILRETFKSLG